MPLKTPRNQEEKYRPYFMRNMPDSLRARIKDHADMRHITMEQMLLTVINYGLDMVDKETQRIRESIEARSQVIARMLRQEGLDNG